MDYKWYAALAYVRANRLNHNVIEGPNDRFGIIASGKAFNDTRQALADLGLDDDACRALGIRLHKVNVVWPLEATITREFAQGLQEILVVEEKRQVIEYQLKEELYNWRARRAAERARQVRRAGEPGRADLTGGEWSMPNPSENWLLRAKADLTPAIIAKAIAKRLKKLGVPADIAARMDARIAVIDAQGAQLAAIDLKATPATARRGSAPAARTTPAPACPKARARWPASAATTWRCGWTAAPHLHADGRRRRAVGRPGAVHDRQAHLRQPRRRHLLPQRPAGDPPEHRRGREHHLQDPLQRRGRDDRRPAGRRAARRPLGAADHAEPDRRRRREAGHRHRRAGEVRRRGAVAPASRCTTATSSTASSASSASSRAPPRSSTTRPAPPRSAAAASAARWSTPTKRVVINELVCEGCGDCSVQSNCLSVEPVETEFGRKRRINQNTCNKDYSCVKGFCPSFVTVEGGQLKKPKKDSQKGDRRVAAAAARAGAAAGRSRPGASSSPASAAPASSPSASCSAWPRTSKARASSRRTPAGLAQKGGATWSHIQIANRPDVDPHHQGRHREGRPRDRLRRDRRGQQGHAGGDARGPHLRRAEHARHADRGLRAATPTGSPRAATARPRSAQAVGAAQRRRVRRRAGGRAAARRLDLHQPADARLRLAEGPRAADAAPR